MKIKNQSILYFLILTMILSGCYSLKSINISNLEHKALGKASLIGSKQSVIVKDIGKSGLDGVSVGLNNSKSWSANVFIKMDLGGFTSFDAIGKSTDSPLESEAKLFKSLDEEGFKLYAEFDHQFHDVEIYNNGVLVIKIEKQPSTDKLPILITDPDMDEDHDGDSKRPRTLSGTTKFRQAMISDSGSTTPVGNEGRLICFWEVDYYNTKTFMANGAYYSGNRIRFVEHIPKDNVTKEMLFDRIDILAGNLEFIILSNQKVSSTN